MPLTAKGLVIMTDLVTCRRGLLIRTMTKQLLHQTTGSLLIQHVVVGVHLTAGDNFSHYRYIQYLTRKYVRLWCTVESRSFAVISLSFAVCFARSGTV